MTRMAKLTNAINTSVVVEDLGIILNSKESKLVDIEVANRSRDLTLKIKERMIIKQIVNHPEVGNFWPFHTQSQKPPEIIIDPKKIENDDLRDQVRSLTNKLDSLINVLATKEPTVINNYINQNLDSSQSTSSAVSNSSPRIKPDEIVFIPSKIVPDTLNENIRLTSKNEEVHSGDFDQTREALREMRKKSKM